ncbi:MAG: response regulator [Proteobacteria bacterium]|nr:response regulator [Pseudomonadota bacterium]MBU1386526.1 response regulator [Pseudomonadota bacterium]MBU1544637.1 response regulator [Pseudomonadota bacterium]MBU2481384.1 response regulator [Pseudomonadota bacterium]
MKKETAKAVQIMIIDNDKYIRESLSTFLKNERFKLLIFKSGEEGLNAFKYQDIDVVIADYFLPDMDGMTLLKQVAVDKPGTARILMATLTNDELRSEISKNKIDALIEKPLCIASIDTILDEIIKTGETQ